MMSKTQTIIALFSGLIASVLLASVLLKILPFSELNNLLIAGFCFPLLTAFIVVSVVRGKAFSEMLKWFGGLAAVSALTLLFTASI